MSNKTYDILKQVAWIVLPLSVFITTLTDIWKLPYGLQVAQTLAGLDVFLGSILSASNYKYNKEQEDKNIKYSTKKEGGKNGN